MPAVALLACAFAAIGSVASVAEWDVPANDWVAADSLGRTLPNYGDCRTPQADRFVGIFYFTWMSSDDNNYGPQDIAKILAENPTNPQWGPQGSAHYWGESELGYYVLADEYVIRKHCQMFVDAGIDVILVDATNNTSWNYQQLLNTMQNLKNEGVKVPKFCLVTHPFSSTFVQIAWNEVYSQNKYSDMWFYWEGKPLILGISDGLDPTLQSFFTFRQCWAWSNSWWFPGPTALDKWTFLDHYPQGFGYHTGPDAPEETSVCMAQHPTTNIGRSFHNGSQPGPENFQTNEGPCFAEQWSRALQIDPRFIFITGWNEWGAPRQIATGGETFLGQTLSAGETFFVDQYNQEYSRDAEPMKGGHTDNYYYQMTDYIRRYKGVRAPEAPTVPTAMTIDGSFTDWDAVGPEYRDHIGDKVSRNHRGWGSATYSNTTGRNDFVLSKAARDDDFVYFYIETKDDITSYGDPNWMLLFIDSDCNSSTGWNGYDYLLNSPVVDADTTTLKHTTGGWNWTTVSSDISYNVSGKKLEIAIPREAIGQDAGENVQFDFHWADNIQVDDDIIEFSVSGDSAPNRRFSYRYNTTPGPVTNLTATPGVETITLNWINPADTDLARVMIRFKTDGYPTSPTDGVLVVDRAAVPGASDSYVHTELATVTHYYTAFAYDRFSSSSSATAFGIPLCFIELADTFDAHSNGNLGGQGNWTTTGAASAQVQTAVAYGGAGKSALMDTVASGGLTITDEMTFPARTHGYYYISLDTSQDLAVGNSIPLVATVAVYASDSATEIAKLKIQKGKLSIDPPTSVTQTVLNGAWWNVKIGFDIATRKLDVWFGGVRKVSNYPWKIGSGTDIAKIVISSTRSTAFTKQKIYIDNLSIMASPAAVPQVRDDGSYTPALDKLHFSFDPTACSTEYRYCIGTTSGGFDTKDWTPCSPTDVTATGLPLAEGQQYFISVQAGNGTGLWGQSAISDGITVAAGTTIPAAKGLADGQIRALRGKTVSAVFPGYFYVQEPGRPYGVKVVSAAAVSAGQTVDVAGEMKGAGAERYLDSTSGALFATAGPGVPEPLAMSNRALGGSDLGPFAPGVKDGIGPNNIGSYVRVWGKVTQKSSSYFYISDGSHLSDGTNNGTENNIGARVDMEPGAYQTGDYVIVTGIVSVFDEGSVLMARRIIPTSIQKLAP